MKVRVFEGSSGTESIDRGSCELCEIEKCRSPWINPQKGRSPVEVTGINVAETCKGFGFRLRCHAVGDFCGIRLFLVI